MVPFVDVPVSFGCFFFFYLLDDLLLGFDFWIELMKPVLICGEMYCYNSLCFSCVWMICSWIMC